MSVEYESRTIQVYESLQKLPRFGYTEPSAEIHPPKIESWRDYGPSSQRSRVARLQLAGHSRGCQVGPARERG